MTEPLKTDEIEVCLLLAVILTTTEERTIAIGFTKKAQVTGRQRAHHDPKMNALSIVKLASLKYNVRVHFSRVKLTISLKASNMREITIAR